MFLQNVCPCILYHEAKRNGIIGQWDRSRLHLRIVRPQDKYNNGFCRYYTMEQQEKDITPPLEPRKRTQLHTSLHKKNTGLLSTNPCFYTFYQLTIRSQNSSAPSSSNPPRIAKVILSQLQSERRRSSEKNFRIRV